MNNPSEREQLKAIFNNPEIILQMDNPPLSFQIIACNLKMQLLEKMPEETQVFIIQQDKKNIIFIDNPSTKVQLTAVKQDGYLILYIENPSEATQEYIILNYPDFVLKYPEVENKISSKLKRKYSHVLAGEDLGI